MARSFELRVPKGLGCCEQSCPLYCGTCTTPEPSDTRFAVHGFCRFDHLEAKQSFTGVQGGRSWINFRSLLGQASDVRAWLRSPPCMRTFSKSNGFANKEPTAPGPRAVSRKAEGSASHIDTGKRRPVKAPAETLMNKGDVFSLVPPVTRYYHSWYKAPP